MILLCFNNWLHICVMALIGSAYPKETIFYF